MNFTTHHFRLLLSATNWQISFSFEDRIFKRWKLLITSLCLTQSQPLYLVITYQMYISMTVCHRRTGCFTKFRIPGADTSFLKTPAFGFNFRFNLSFPLPRAIYCNTSSASSIFPWEYNHRGDSGSILTGKNRKSTMTSSFLLTQHSLKSIFPLFKSMFKVSTQNSEKAFYLHCFASQIPRTW